MIRPLFISVEGVDGSGKTSAIPIIVEAFKAHGIDIVTTRDPGGSPGGEAIRNIIKSRELGIERSTHFLLQMASRNELVHKTILPHLKAGRCVVSDRYTDSTLVYQGAIDGFSEEIKAVWGTPAFSVHKGNPDYTFFMDVSEKTYTDRLASRGLDNLEEIWQKQSVRPDAAYRMLLKDNPDVQAARAIIPIDADQSLDNVAQQIRSAISDIILYEQHQATQAASPK